jgi:hypothetical protein
MKTAKIGAIFVISIMALSGTGAAYALWYDYLHLDVDVETGYIGMDWSLGQPWDTEPADKDFSYVTAELLPWGESDLGRLFIHIYNAYPCIDYVVPFDLHNTGTIPIHLSDPEMWIDGDDNMLTGEDGWGTIKILVDGVEMQWEGWQIHPGEVIYGDIIIHFNNNLPQDIYSWIYCMNIPYHQWNEDYPEDL